MMRLAYQASGAPVPLPLSAPCLAAAPRAPAIAEDGANAAGARSHVKVAVFVSAAGAVAAVKAKKGSSRRQRAHRAARQAGIFQFFKEIFKSPEQQEPSVASAVASPGPENFNIRVSSSQSTGQPFCGEYEEQPYRLNERGVFKKIGMPAGSQAVYLLHNEAGQWSFTPHMDGRPDGWGFVADPAMVPEQITGVFKLWDGKTWVDDSTLKLSGPGSAAVAAGAAPVVQQAAAEGAIAQASSAAVKPGMMAQAGLIESAPLPPEAEPLAALHWKAHWAMSERCLFHFAEPEVSKQLSQKFLPTHPDIRRGVLPNGLRYVILRNAMPPKRFEAHLELHVGSIDEEPHEQGIAHMMEHVCFLGSRKRERLIGTGSRSNALTDFQHTIYHIHSPVKLEDGRNMFIPALEALHEIAFAPEMLPFRIEKERKAVLAEMQQVNDMEYRIETWTLSGLHETNKLGTQFPIGKEEQIKGWQQQDLKNFWTKWYYPGNATLFVVGDLEEDEIISGIERVFKPVPARNEFSPGVASSGTIWGESSADPRSLFRRKIARERPEQLHNFSVPMIGTEDVYTQAAAFDTSLGEKPWHGPVRICRNELLESLQINFYAKAPVRPLRTLEDIRHLLAVRILVGVLQFRIVSRYSSNHAPVQVDHSDSFREGCAVTSITVNTDPRDWRNGLACVVQEIRALCDYGITEGEMKRYMDAMVKDTAKGVAENDTVPSEDHLNFIMTSDVFDHVIMHPEQSYLAFQEVAPHVTMEQVHNVAKWMLGFIGYYGMAAAPPPTAIVVCTPTQVHDENTGTWSPFTITEEEIIQLLCTVPEKSKAEALSKVEVPESLLRDQLEKLLAQHPVDAATAWRATSRKVDHDTGIVQLMLPNGARVNYSCTSNESQGTMRMLVPGGRASDPDEELGASMVGVRTISESGAVSDYTREQIELFAVSNMMSVHMDCNQEFTFVDSTFTVSESGFVAVLELLHLLFQEPRWELPAFVRAQQAYKAQAYAVGKSLEQSTMDRLLRSMYSDPRISEPRVDDINRLTMAKVKKSVQGQLRPQDLEINLVGDFEGRTQHKIARIEGSLSTGKHREASEPDGDAMVIEVPEVARERRLKELDEMLWRYLGLLPPSPAPQVPLTHAPQMNQGEELTPADRQRVAHMEDSDERAIANIGGGAPNRWGKGDRHHTEVMKQRGFSWEATGNSMMHHPLYPSMCLLAMREVLNTRLFSTVRDSLGLSYDCSFELSLYDRLEAGHYACTVSAHPSRITEAVNAAKGVLGGAKTRPISELELSTARRTLLRRHETDLQTNEYWISLLTHLQYDNPKDVTCVRDIELLLSKLTWRDAQNAYNSLLTDPNQLFVSISTAGPGASYVAGGAAPASVSTRDAAKQLLTVD